MNLVKSIFTGREPVLYTALARQAIMLGAAFGLGLTTEQTAAVMGTVEVLVWLFLRQKVSPFPSKNSGKAGLVSIVLIASIALSGCGLINRATSMFADQYRKWGPEFEKVVKIVCGVAESKARGVGYQDARDMFCMSRQQLEPYAAEAAGALQRAEAGAIGRMRSESE